MINIYDLFDLNTVSISLRVVLSLVIGGVIGLERSRKNHPAGFRTYMLVCLSATLIMMTSQFMYTHFENVDPARLGAQVISGIGFLGVGTIIVTRRNQVRGLTTAAGLWTSACLGLSIGIGFYEGAIIVGLIVFIVMTFFKKIDNYLTSNNRIITIYVSFSSIENFDKFIIFSNNLNLKVVDIEISKNSNGKESGIIAILNLRNKELFPHIEILRNLSTFEGLNHIEEL